MALRESLDRCGDITESDEIFLHVYAPVIAMYSEWILQRAAESGKECLYFMARDGYMPLIAAQLLREKLGTDIELRYLKASRYAVRRAEYAMPETDRAGSICVGGIDMTFDKMMKRGALTEDETEFIAGRSGYSDRRGCILQYREIAELCSRLKKIPEFDEYVISHSGECLENACGYFRQEGLYGDRPYAIVDSGWLGTVLKSVSHLTGQEINGYYFGLYEMPAGIAGANVESFYLSPYKDIERKTRFCICLFETVCSAPEGMTMGYCKDAGEYRAVESESLNPNAGQIKRNSELLRMFMESYEPEENTPSVYAEFTERLLSVHMGRPTAREAEIFGRLQFCDDVLESGMQDVAADWDAAEIKKQGFVNKFSVRLGIKKEKLKESGWPEASIVNATDRPERALVNERMYKRMMYLRKAAMHREKY